MRALLNNQQVGLQFNFFIGSKAAFGKSVNDKIIIDKKSGCCVIVALGEMREETTQSRTKSFHRHGTCSRHVLQYRMFQSKVV